MERKTFLSRPKLDGLWVRLRFRDDDALEGIVSNNLLDLLDTGVQLTPPDLHGNVLRMFIPRSALAEMKVLGVVGVARRTARATRGIARGRRSPVETLRRITAESPSTKDAVAKYFPNSQIGSLLAAVVLYIGLQERANAASSFTVRKPHSAVRAAARSVARARPFRRASRGRPHSREQGIGRPARRASHDRRERLRRTRIRRPDSGPRGPRHVHLRDSRETVFAAAAIEWQWERTQRADALGSAFRR